MVQSASFGCFVPILLRFYLIIHVSVSALLIKFLEFLGIAFVDESNSLVENFFERLVNIFVIIIRLLSAFIRVHFGYFLNVVVRLPCLELVQIIHEVVLIYILVLLGILI